MFGASEFTATPRPGGIKPIGVKRLSRPGSRFAAPLASYGSEPQPKADDVSGSAPYTGRIGQAPVPHHFQFRLMPWRYASRAS